MPALTRRRYPERPDCWHIYFGDVLVGSITRRTGQPHDQDAWEWRCGFYPWSDFGEDRNGTAASFEAARAAFEAAWLIFSARRTEADYQAWRDHRDLTAWKYAMRDAGRQLPTCFPSGRSQCFCGAPIEIATMDRHVLAEHHG